MPLIYSNPKEMPFSEADYCRRLYRRHVQGALVRSGASLFMWIAAWVSLLFGAIQSTHSAFFNYCDTFCCGIHLLLHR